MSIRRPGTSTMLMDSSSSSSVVHRYGHPAMGEEVEEEGVPSINLLPDELCLLVLYFLDVHDLLSVSRVLSSAAHVFPIAALPLTALSL